MKNEPVKALPPPAGAPPPPPPNPPPNEPPRYPIPERCIFLVNDVPAMKFVIAWSIVPVVYFKHAAGITDEELWNFIDPAHFHRIADMAGIGGRAVADMVRRFRAVGLIRSNGTCDVEALTYVRRELNAYEDSLKP
jgi:hypothetical protein